MQIFLREVLSHSEQPLLTPPEKMSLLGSYLQVRFQEQAPRGMGLRIVNFGKKQSFKAQFYHL